ncbi:unnamed protein product [Staurois parvus]|uniref:Uncharacterized protein n=1 Tax=Staurois parvus TaxID=386267 RepID=A0ABN9HEG1_9NEOB|nr:unnamed protein product [Staurois parvus]
MSCQSAPGYKYSVTFAMFPLKRYSHKQCQRMLPAHMQ